ncbi:MAG: L-threonylcarbamoyladenylate synthase [Thermodesulfobacteriota bacterium]|nr:L-threonylcarbamoyladenylate synthase [Thermodesulfobacteriota bacterium]
MVEVIKVDPIAPDVSIIKEAALLIKRNRVVVFPTETLYGLGANALCEKSVSKVFEIKGRTYEKPLPILIDKKESLYKYVTHVPEKAKRLIENFWPGVLTIIFNASSTLPSMLTGNTGKIGIRISRNIIAQQLVQQTGIPITATSANISGYKICTTAHEVYEALGHTVDLIIDDGENKGLSGSTIVDATITPAIIIRQGILRSEELKEYLQAN